MNIKHTQLTLLLAAIFIFSSTIALAQDKKSHYRDLVKQELNRAVKARSESHREFIDFSIDALSYSPQSRRTIVYIQHEINGIPIQGAISIMAFNKADKLQYKDISRMLMVNGKASAIPSFSLARHKAQAEALLFLATTEKEVRNAAPQSMTSPIKVEKVYVKNGSRFIPAYRIEVYLKMTDIEVVTVDGRNGEILDAYNKVLHCYFQAPVNSVEYTERVNDKQMLLLSSTDTFSYNVAPLPDINILEKGRRIIVNPADTVASPLGWHYGEDSVESIQNILEGNNIIATLDRDGNFIKDDTIRADSSGSFNFPMNLSKEPGSYGAASLTQLFVTTNQFHDILYHNQFDEYAGSFQIENFHQSDSVANDPVLVYGQFGAAVQGGGRNNAFFVPAVDGQSGRMVMYVWTSAQDRDLLVIEPSQIAGRYVAGGASFTPSVEEQPIEGEVVLVDDGTDVTTDACSDLINTDEIAGKIAMIDRGSCNFDRKVQRAEQAGAIGVIICNNEGTDEVIQMGGSIPASIPAIMVGKSNCDTLKLYLDDLYVSFSSESAEGPQFRDGSLDNTIPTHEYGHGVSNRLVGGPATVSCLRSAEQMGEGWSDILALILTMSDENYQRETRGMGSYAMQGTVTGKGIRYKLYSPDFAVNNYTYSDIAGSSGEEHNIGEVWATVLWDLTRKLVEKEGFDEDLIHGNGGNRIALKLIVEGMKYTACNPGFVDGRDGILAADSALYNGKYHCLIWKVFARRGLGYYADQGSPNDIFDGVEDFHLNPYCDARIKVEKSVTPFAEASDTVEVHIAVFNHNQEAAEQIVVVDSIPPGAEFIQSTGENKLVWDDGKLRDTISTLAFNDTVSYSYTYQLSNQGSIKEWENTFETAESYSDNYSEKALNDGYSNVEWVENAGKDSTGAVKIDASNIRFYTDQAMILKNPIHVSEDKPLLILNHRYDIALNMNGAFIEYSLDGENWFILDTALISGGYNSSMYSAELGAAYSKAFSGDVDWTRTAIDLSPWKGLDIYLRYRLVTYTNGNATWLIDGISAWERLSYNPPVKVSSDSTVVYAVAPGYGTIVFGSTDTVSTSDKTLDIQVTVSPQPFHQTFRIDIPSDILPQVNSMSIYSMEGKIMKYSPSATEQIIDASEWPAGVYILQIDTDMGRVTKKLLKQ